MERLIKRFCLTLFITLAYCEVWCLTEKIVNGYIENRIVDNIMMFLFIPIIFISTDVFIKGTQKELK